MKSKHINNLKGFEMGISHFEHDNNATSLYVDLHNVTKVEAQKIKEWNERGKTYYSRHLEISALDHNGDRVKLNIVLFSDTRNNLKVTK